MKAFQDLRFSIGLFFVLVGAFLILAGFLEVDRASLNFYTGAGLLVFGALAILLREKSAHE